MFPDPEVQQKKLALLGIAGALGNVRRFLAPIDLREKETEKGTDDLGPWTTHRWSGYVALVQGFLLDYGRYLHLVREYPFLPPLSPYVSGPDYIVGDRCCLDANGQNPSSTRPYPPLAPTRHHRCHPNDGRTRMSRIRPNRRSYRRLVRTRFPSPFYPVLLPGHRVLRVGGENPTSISRLAELSMENTQYHHCQFGRHDCVPILGD